MQKMNLSLIVAPRGPDSISESIILRQNCTYLSSLTLDKLIRCIGAFVVTGFEVRGPFSVLPASWQPVSKATTPKCASWGVLGNTTALCAACLWINADIAESGTCICIMYVRISSLMIPTHVFITAAHWSGEHRLIQTAACGPTGCKTHLNEKSNWCDVVRDLHRGDERRARSFNGCCSSAFFNSHPQRLITVILTPLDD